MPATSLRKLYPEDYKEWDEIIYDLTGGTIFHKSWWVSCTAKEFEIVGYFKGKNLVGGAVIPYIKKYGIKIIYNPPLTPYTGPVFKETGKKISILSDQKKFLTHLSMYIRQNFSGIKIFTSPSTISLLPFLMENFKPIYKYTYILGIGDINKAWDNMDKRTRNAIRSAIKSGIEVRECGIKEVLEVVKKTFERQKLKIDLDNIILNTGNILAKKNSGKCFVAVNPEGQIIAGICVVWDTKRAYYLLGGYDYSTKHSGATSLLLWHSMNFVRDRIGITEFDFEGSKIPQIESFFRKFGGDPTPVLGVEWTKPYLSFKILSLIAKILKRL